MDNFGIAVLAIVDIIGDEFGYYPHQQMMKDVRMALLDTIDKLRTDYNNIEDIRTCSGKNEPNDFYQSLEEAREIYYANKEREAKDDN
jgi:hypothetical protein